MLAAPPRPVTRPPAAHRKTRFPSTSPRPAGERHVKHQTATPIASGGDTGRRVCQPGASRRMSPGGSDGVSYMKPGAPACRSRLVRADAREGGRALAPTRSWWTSRTPWPPPRRRRARASWETCSRRDVSTARRWRARERRRERVVRGRRRGSPAAPGWRTVGRRAQGRAAGGRGSRGRAARLARGDGRARARPSPRGDARAGCCGRARSRRRRLASMR